MTQRTALAFVPASYKPREPHRLLVAVHDTGQSGKELIDELGLRAFAERDGVVIVLPETTNLMHPWRTKEERVSVLEALAVARDQLCLTSNVRVLGYGAGGYLAERMVCATPEVSRVASISYRRHADDKPCGTRVVPTLQISPLQDGRQPVDGGGGCLGGEDIIGLAEHEEFLRSQHQCRSRRKLSLKHPTGRCFEHTCEIPLVTCQVDGGRPLRGGPRLADCEGSATNFPYGNLAWRFLFDEPAAAE